MAGGEDCLYPTKRTLETEVGGSLVAGLPGLQSKTSLKKKKKRGGGGGMAEVGQDLLATASLSVLLVPQSLMDPGF